MTVWLFCASARCAVGSRLYHRGDRLDLLLNLPGQILRLARALLRGLGQRADFVSHNGEATAVIAGARRFDGGVEGQEIGLVRNITDGLCDISDACRLSTELLDDGDRAGLPFPIVLDVARPRPDLV